jgi:hypothetical protein
MAAILRLHLGNALGLLERIPLPTAIHRQDAGQAMGCSFSLDDEHEPAIDGALHKGTADDELL